MKFVLAPDSFKECMTAIEAAHAMKRGIKKVFPHADCVMIPMADGGEGLVEAILSVKKGKIMKTNVLGPLGNPIIAKYGIVDEGKTAIIEMASASGLEIIRPEVRNPLVTTTYGTGELIKEALDLGVTKILLGIGGSATNDGGVGMLQALGASFQDENGQELPFGGGALQYLHSIDVSSLDRRLQTVKLDVACDVTNPLIGKNGASAIFGPQKGATPEMVEQLDRNLSHFAKIIREINGKEVAFVPGAGAAGGLGAGLMAFLNVKLCKGIELVIEYTGLREHLKHADYVFTGEGSIDEQTLFGKVLFGVSSVAKEHSIPVIAFAGKIGPGVDVLYKQGFSAIISILTGISSLEEALRLGKSNLEFAVENICKVLNLSNQQRNKS